jgi:ribonuclease HII
MSAARSRRICGIDEAGRGALAGPLVAAAVILHCSLNKVSRLAKTKIRDGKLLDPLARRRIYTALRKLKAEISLEVISSRKINNRGIQRANREAIRSLIKRVEANWYIVDGKLKLGRIAGKTSRVRSIVDADATIPEVILAGIVAKVERDKIMSALHKQFPHYGWHANAGYGTRKHIEAIQIHSMTYYHRSIFVTTALRNHTKLSS